jgi:hypothetical protein
MKRDIVDNGDLILQLAEKLNPKTAFTIVTDEELGELRQVCFGLAEGDLLIYQGENLEVAMRVREGTSRGGETYLAISYADPDRPGVRVTQEVKSVSQAQEIVQEVLLRMMH